MNREFKNKILNAVREKMGKRYRIEVQQVKKNNGIILNGLVITKQNMNVSPTIYLEPYYQQLMEGVSLEKILADILDVYEQSRESIPDLAVNLKNYDEVRDKIIYRLIRREGNEELLNEVPYKEFLDLAVVYYLLLGVNEKGQMTALVRHEHMRLWNVTIEALHHEAEHNSKNLLPASVRLINDVICDGFEIEGNLEAAEMFRKAAEEDVRSAAKALWVLTNDKNIYGAAVLLYDGILESVAQKWGQDIIILPSSVHETLLIRCTNGMDLPDLQRMVGDVNEIVPDEDVLSDHVYIYERETGMVRIAI